MVILYSRIDDYYEITVSRYNIDFMLKKTIFLLLLLFLLLVQKERENDRVSNLCRYLSTECVL